MTLGALRTLGFQFNRIVRRSAHDGTAYENNECAWRDGAERHPDSQYLAKARLSRGHYCYTWTWYDILLHIAKQPSPTFYLMLLDDCWPTLPYRNIANQISLLQSSHPVKVIQFIQGCSDAKAQLDASLGCPIPGSLFRHGLFWSGDLVNIVTPAGAKELISAADQPMLCLPEGIFRRLQHVLSDMSGYYSPQYDTQNECPGSFGRHSGGNELIGEPEDSAIGTPKQGHTVNPFD